MMPLLACLLAQATAAPGPSDGPDRASTQCIAWYFTHVNGYCDSSFCGIQTHEKYNGVKGSVCECLDGYAPGAFNNGCSSTVVCPSSQFLNTTTNKCQCPIWAQILVNGACVDKKYCGGALAAYDDASNTCKCSDASWFISSSGDACVASCAEGETFTAEPVRQCHPCTNYTHFVFNGACVARRTCNGDTTTPIAGQNACQCKDAGQLLNAEGTACYAACEAGSFMNIAGTQCVKSVADCGANYDASQTGQCACATTHVKIGDKCVLKARCDATTTNFVAASNTCACKTSSHLLSADGLSCGTTCAFGYLNSTGNGCLLACPENQLAVETAPKSCLACPTNTHVLIQNRCVEKARCVSPMVINATGNTCDCPDGYYLHADGTCSTATCGSIAGQVWLANNTCGCPQNAPVFDAPGKRCIATGAYCAAIYEQAVSVDGKKCVFTTEAACKRVNLDRQRCLDSCSETGATDGDLDNVCVCQSGLVLVNGACVAPFTVGCASPSFLHVDGICSTALCGSKIPNEVLGAENVCQCADGSAYIGYCWSAAKGVTCAEGYAYLEQQQRCISAEACAAAPFGGVVTTDEEGTKYCGCSGLQVFNVAGTACVNPEGCSAHSYAPEGTGRCQCDYGFSQSGNACVADHCDNTTAFNRYSAQCGSASACAGIQGSILQVETQPDAMPTYDYCVCPGFLDVQNNMCLGQNIKSCVGANTTTSIVDSLPHCECAAGFVLENGFCVKDRGCAYSSFLHVDGTCDQQACGTKQNEASSSTPEVSCGCRQGFAVGNKACVSTTVCTPPMVLNANTNQCECGPLGYTHANGQCTFSPCSSLSHEVLGASRRCVCNTEDGYSFDMSLAACLCGSSRYIQTNGKCTSTPCNTYPNTVTQTFGNENVCACMQSAMLHVDGSCEFTDCGSKPNEESNYHSGTACQCRSMYALINGQCVYDHDCSGGFLHVSGVCDTISCGNIIGERYSETQQRCECESSTPFFSIESNACVAACPTDWKTDKITHVVPTCVAQCSFPNPYNAEFECLPFCPALYSTRLSDGLCYMNSGKLSAVIVVPVAGVIAAAVLTVFFVHKKKTGSAKSKRGHGTSRNAVIVEVPSLPDPFYISLPKRDNPNAIVGMK